MACGRVKTREIALSPKTVNDFADVDARDVGCTEGGWRGEWLARIVEMRYFGGRDAGPPHVVRRSARTACGRAHNLARIAGRRAGPLEGHVARAARRPQSGGDG